MNTVSGLELKLPKKSLKLHLFSVILLWFFSQLIFIQGHYNCSAFDSDFLILIHLLKKEIVIST